MAATVRIWAVAVGALLPLQSLITHPRDLEPRVGLAASALTVL